MKRILSGYLIIIHFIRFLVKFILITVKNSFQYFNKNVELNKEDFKSILGYNPHDLWHKLTSKEKILCHYILLNSVKLGQIVKESM